MAPPPDGTTLKNPPNPTNKIVVGCDCGICTLDPFDAGVGGYTKEDMNAVFQMLVGEATSPNQAKKMKLNATTEEHEKEAFAISSAIFNRARYDKALMEKRKRPAPVKWGFESDGTPLGVAASGKVIAYTEKHHEKYFEQARKLGELSKGKPYCEWLLILKAQAEKAAKDPAKRDLYNEWRTHGSSSKSGRTQILGTDLWEKKLDYPELMKD
jgi:hypothetical protein